MLLLFLRIHINFVHTKAETTKPTMRDFYSYLLCVQGSAQSGFVTKKFAREFYILSLAVGTRIRNGF